MSRSDERAQSESKSEIRNKSKYQNPKPSTVTNEPRAQLVAEENTMSITAPKIDPTPIFEIFRGSYATELLTAAVAHFKLFSRLARAPRTFAELSKDLGLAERPMNVLVTALRAFGFVHRDDQ